MAKLSTNTRRRRKIDRLDMKILTTLAENSRQTITEIARKVGLSSSPCTTRLERLEQERMIIGYCTDIDVEQLGDLSLYHVTIAGKPHTAELARKLEALIVQNPFIVSADAVFGSLDYVLRVYARNAQHYHEIMAPFAEHKIDYETWPVSRRIVRSQSRRLMEALARDES
jgi:Lrp/AsnC family transcriptional regulator, leucine-responsive regulatory protein